ADVEVGPAVPVQVGPGGAGGPGDALVQAGPGADVHEAAAAPAVGHIAEQGDAAPAGDEQVGPAVGAVGGDGGGVAVDPRPPAGQAAQADLLGDVLELPVAQVLVELAGVPTNLLVVRPSEVAAADHEDVQEAVAVVVDQ